MKTTVHIYYYAILREQSGLSDEFYETEAVSVGNLYRELSEKYSFTLPLHLIKAAVNDEFVDLNQPLRSKDNVIFIPPVAGG